MAKKTLLDNIIESIKDVDSRLIKQSGTTKQMISDLNYKVVAPAESAANSAYSMASQAVEQANVTKQAQAATDQAITEAKQGANDAMSRAVSAWDVATGAKEAVTDFDPLLKSAQSDAGKALTQIADTANALSDAKTAFGSDVAVAKNLANTAQVTADSAATVAVDARSNATVAIQTASQASLTAINANNDATVAKQNASEAKVQASNAESDFAQISIRANKIEANVANNSGAIASVQQTANGLTTTVSDLKNQFTQTKESVDGISTTINDPKTGLNATYQTASGNATTISNVKSDVYQLQTTASGLTSRVGNLESKTNTQETAIEQNKNAITLKADQTTVDKINGTVGQLQSTLTVQAGQIQEKVTSSQVTGMLTGYATQEYTQSLVTQKANDWNLNLTNLKTDVDAIKTTGGGANLANGTTSEDQLYGDASQTTGWRTPTIATFDNPQAGKQYTVSVNAKPNGGSWKIQIWDGTSPTQRAKWLCSESTNATQEQKHVLTFTWPSGMNKYLIVQLSNSNDGGQIVWNSAMIEEGTVAHDWSPAPSDMATVTSVTNLSATVDGIKSTVATKADQSTVTELSNLVQTKVSSDDFTSTTTQLKNEINQRVQVGDVISQINQEAGGDTLIQVSNGKKTLILDAGNTVFTGKAWIPSAAISNIQADQVQIGNSRLFGDDGSLNLINPDAGNASIKLTTGTVLGSTQPVTQFANGYNTNAMDISPVGTVIRPSLFFEDYPGQAKDNGWLGFSRHNTAEVQFNTYDNSKELFRIACAARVNHDLHVDGDLWQGGLSIASGNTIWSGSDFLAIGTHLTNSYGNVMARSFSSQSTLSSKTNIETVDPKYALDLVNRTDIRSYQYTADVAIGKTKRYTSMIIDDVHDVSQYYAPDEFTNEERTGRDDGSAVGYLFLAVKELTRRIKILEDKLNE